ncbi:MAG: hypothetical protein A3H63_01330 [Candidatus Harrisonbacteria bacterium RIFCSPLOWO2_02_FULL_45_10c]|uniref:Peptidase C39 domain-containing protein n=1 Tax=Candidatus Harrisonbacteria bacterium RIFCSPLOWO2_02_FULL_45_10c TaxID=1798410 RepID=A0A1G1ZTB5_9BACT|nr:MAG: hypothetical protein A3H63_01330 [Candidatus Harrisonbacteria bacterium RIFCSPLOWO2_02_FULL_45_10c]
MEKIIPYYRQKNKYYCGPASLAMVFDYFGKRLSQERLAKELHTTPREGSDNPVMIRVAKRHGFSVSTYRRANFQILRRFLDKRVPVIVAYIEPAGNEGHYAVVSSLTRNYIVLRDPWNGKNFQLSRYEFLRRWRDEEKKQERWLMAVQK